MLGHGKCGRSGAGGAKRSVDEVVNSDLRRSHSPLPAEERWIDFAVGVCFLAVTATAAARAYPRAIL